MVTIVTPRSISPTMMRGPLLGRQRLDLQLDARVAPADPLGGERQQGECRRAAGADAQEAQPLVADPVGVGLQRLDLAEDPVGIAEQQVRLGRGDQPAAHQLEQRVADLALEVAQHLADRRLRDAERLGRRGQRAVAHDGAEDLELARVQEPSRNPGLWNW
ncbi:MAG: hypothetical protein U1E53_23680 [Dongiaceae bacterium]